MASKTLRVLAVLALWLSLTAFGATTRSDVIVDLVYKARRLGADYETVIKICKGHWICTQVAMDAYGVPTPTPYIELTKERTCYRSSDPSCLPSPHSADNG